LEHVAQSGPHCHAEQIITLAEPMAAASIYRYAALGVASSSLSKTPLPPERSFLNHAPNDAIRDPRAALDSTGGFSFSLDLFSHS
jgi:hypothetical protein